MSSFIVIFNDPYDDTDIKFVASASACSFLSFPLAVDTIIIHARKISFSIYRRPFLINK